MDKIAVMGDYDSIYGFAALGLVTFPVDLHDFDAARKTLRQLAENGYGVIYITEQLAELLTEEIRRYAERITPAIVLIPGVQGNTGAGVKNVKRSVEQAVGSDILFS